MVIEDDKKIMAGVDIKSNPALTLYEKYYPFYDGASANRD